MLSDCKLSRQTFVCILFKCPNKVILNAEVFAGNYGKSRVISPNRKNMDKVADFLAMNGLSDLVGAFKSIVFTLFVSKFVFLIKYIRLS